MNTVETTTRGRLRVMMITEGTYPYHWGGVSTWCHLLLNDLPNVDFTLISLVADPAAKPQFNLPASVTEFRPIPIWGIREMLETHPSLGMADLCRRKWSTKEPLVAREFVPRFRAFVEELFADSADPHRLATIVHSMHRFFLNYDFDKAMRSQLVWNSFVQVVQQSFPRAAAQHGYAGEHYTLTDMTICFHWLYHWLLPLASPLPKVDIAHAAMAGMCTLVAVAAKLEHGAAFMLTEHGIYLRERYLAEANSAVSLFRKIFSLRFARRMTELSYAMADMVAPCCDFNQRWELRNGARLDQLKTIYYGVDPVVFTPVAKAAGEPPVVVWVGRIDPLKDLLTLLRAAALVHAQRPDVEFRLFGSVPAGNEAYYDKCLELRRELELEQTVIFAGFRANPASAFNEGDVAVLSSVSEAFPFVILEAMLCEKPVVATAVGGVPEQIAECGLIVEPRNHEAMAAAILVLINDPELSRSLGYAARQKAMHAYSVRQSAQAHESAYLKMASRKPGTVPMRAPALQYPNQRSIPFLRARSAPKDSRPIFASGHAPGMVQSARAVAIAVDRPAPMSQGLAPLSIQSVKPRTAVVYKGAQASLPAQTDVQTKVSSVRKLEISKLAAEVAQRSAQPVDGLEVTAILESIGFTDDVASQRFDAADVFALGETVFDTIKTERMSPRRVDSPAQAFVSRKETVADYLKGPLGLVPPILLLLLVTAFGQWGGWTPQQTLVFSAGMTASLMVTNGLLQGIGRRTAIYLGMSKPRMAARYLLASTTFATATVCGLVLLTLFVLNQIGLSTSDNLGVFLLSFAGLTVVWMAAGGLSLLQQPYWLSIALACGLLLGSLVSFVLTPATTYHLAIGCAVGYIATLAVIFIALRRRFASLAARPTSSKALTKLPAPAYLVNEATPYFAYGFAYMVLIFLPHIFGWFGQLPGGQNRSDAVANLEIGLSLSMPPLILACGAAENAMRRFWRQVAIIQAGTPATVTDHFGVALLAFVAQQRRSYLKVLTILTVLAAVAFQYMLGSGWIEQWLPQADRSQLSFLFHMSLVAYWLMGLGLFNCMFAVTLGRPQVALRSVVWGVVVMVATGAMLSSLSFTSAVFAFGLAAFVFAVISWEEANQVLWSADYSFASVLA